MLYKKKPVTIEARLFDVDSAMEVANWCGGSSMRTYDADGAELLPFLEIYTLEGVMRASLGDYIIKGVKGEFYPCKPDIFFETYEEV